MDEITPDQIVTEAVKDFFFDLHAQTDLLNDLPHYWSSLGKLSLTPSQLARILYNTALAIDRVSSGPQEGLELRDGYGLRAYVSENFASWFDGGQHVPEKGYSQDLAKILKALRILHIRPPSEWLREAENWMVKNIDDHNPKTLTECLDGFSHMSHALNPETLDAIRRVVFPALASVPSRVLVDLYFGAALQEVLAGQPLAFSREVHGVLNAAFSHLDEADIQRHFAVDARMRLGHAELWFTGTNEKFPELSDAKPSRWKDRLKAAFNEKGLFSPGIRPASRTMPRIKYETDIAFKIGDRRVHIEADGANAFHILYPSGDLAWSARSIMQTIFMRRHYGNRIVLRLPVHVYHAAKKHSSEHDMVKDIGKLMRHAANNTPANTPETVMAITFQPDTGLALKNI